jgi:hypothetical protein
VRAPELPRREAAVQAVSVRPPAAAVVGGVGREGPGLDEVLEDGHEEEERDEDGRGREPEGDGVHGRAQVPERGRLAPRARVRGGCGGLRRRAVVNVVVAKCQEEPTRRRPARLPLYLKPVTELIRK